MREFFAFRIQDRHGESPIIMMSGRLYQQFLVDAYTMVESNRLRYIWHNQTKLRCDNFDKIEQAGERGNNDLSGQGKKVLIPASFTGSKRFMRKHDLDAMATCKYISPYESSWRLLKIPIQYRTTTVVQLSFHLPGKQMCIYHEGESVDQVLNKASVGQSQFLAWMEANNEYALAKTQTYADFPTKFVWVSKQRKWKIRKQGFAIGRLVYVSPSVEDAYHLRILLNIVKGPESFDYSKKVNGVIYDDKDAYDDKEYIEGIKEASLWGTGMFLRKLFAIMLLSSSVAVPINVWNATWEILTEDFLYHKRREENDPGLVLTEAQYKNLGLLEIERYMCRNGHSLSDYKGEMPVPDDIGKYKKSNHLIWDEKSYDRAKLANDHVKLFSTITNEQKDIYNDIMDAVTRGIRGMFFVYGYGGTGKTYLWRLLGAALRSQGKIVLNVASSGIAALLLEGGRTAHSRFGIPMVVNEYRFCNVSSGSHQAELIEAADLIIWDEAPMMSKHCFETLDRTMRDILKCDKLKTNMRLLRGDNDFINQEIEEFAKWILDIGDGKLNIHDTIEDELEIPADFLISGEGDPVKRIVSEIYGQSYTTTRDPVFFRKGQYSVHGIRMSMLSMNSCYQNSQVFVI
ncbi:uncharacterized protein LOC112089161 [Eutrema salsugineum]|uniref:uncharacterized protein LOC112089161 n=1 Tax=Eutrema salsugineum TaxID=72664 RepID=UPI000CED3F11|nr:uncharacterized protein LOC112089161 [Eutrema salsugineum]